VVPLLSALAALGLIELFLIVFHPVPFSIERNMYFEPDPYTGYRLKPNSRGYSGNGIPANINANGHRDAETAIARRPGVFRILVLGDSFTVGAHVREKEAYPKVLERLLNARSRQPVEVVNTGVGGWDPFMYAEYYEHYGRQFHPDLVLVGFFVGNDTFSPIASFADTPTAVQGRRVSREAASRGALADILVFLTEHFNLARLLLQKAPVVDDVDRRNCEDFRDNYLAIQRDRLANHLKRDAHQEALVQNALRQISRIKALLDADGVPMLVALLPDENQVNPSLQRILVPEGQRDRYDFAMPQSMLTELFGAAGIRTIDLLPAFLGDPRCLYNNTTHWTAEGHALAAAILADQLGPGPWSANGRRRGRK
jgi:lysophospholipase L1-like esterase